jgi:transcriptional regulator with XRE-family HTH domain
MRSEELLERARHDSGLTQDEVARRARTSRPTLSAYEHGRKSPTLATARRLLEATGHDLEAVPRVEFRHQSTVRGPGVWVPDRLWRLSVRRALGTVTLPLHLNWSAPGRTSDMSDRGRRARVYEVVLREGTPDDIRGIIDGALLVDLWAELVLPRAVRAAWDPVIRAELGAGAS